MEGLRKHLTALALGYSRLHVARALLLSTEYAQRVPGNSGFVRDLYSVLLGRAPESSESASYWCRQVADHGREYAIDEFCRSEEVRLRCEKEKTALHEESPAGAARMILLGNSVMLTIHTPSDTRSIIVDRTHAAETARMLREAGLFTLAVIAADFGNSTQAAPVAPTEFT